MSTIEFARLKHGIESRRVKVGRAFTRLDDLLREDKGKANLDTSAEPECNNTKEELVMLERLMEAMSKLNESYKVYTQMLEKRIGF